MTLLCREKHSRHSGTSDGTKKRKKMEELVKTLETKIQLLKLTRDDTPGVLAKGKLSALERQHKTLQSLLDEVHDVKLRVQEKKLAETSAEEVHARTLLTPSHNSRRVILCRVRTSGGARTYIINDFP